MSKTANQNFMDKAELVARKLIRLYNPIEIALYIGIFLALLGIFICRIIPTGIILSYIFVIIGMVACLVQLILSIINPDQFYVYYFKFPEDFDDWHDLFFTFQFWDWDEENEAIGIRVHPFIEKQISQLIQEQQKQRGL